MKHHHEFITVSSFPIELKYIQKPLFGEPYQFIIEALARLQRCECGVESADIIEQPEKFYIDIRDIPAGVGKVDPEWYRQKFMAGGNP